MVTRRSWTILPTPQAVIDRVNALGVGQPSTLTFEHKYGDVVPDTNTPVTHTPSPAEYEIPGDTTEIVEIPGVDSDNNQANLDHTTADDENDF